VRNNANTIFNNAADYSGSTLVLGALFFTFQIYCDFLDYSDIALGTARLFGNRPFKKLLLFLNSHEILQNSGGRWHISLSSCV
jgi:D-alanyl-lipoteichoic acid acyltransferase DltB (MBOAT superfamily)